MYFYPHIITVVLYLVLPEPVSVLRSQEVISRTTSGSALTVPVGGKVSGTSVTVDTAHLSQVTRYSNSPLTGYKDSFYEPETMPSKTVTHSDPSVAGAAINTPDFTDDTKTPMRNKYHVD